jgi:hypothetical protein
VLDQRGQLLRVTVGFARPPHPPYDRALWRCERGSTPGAASATSPLAMHRHGFDLQLTQYDDRGWRATLREQRVVDV